MAAILPFLPMIQAAGAVFSVVTAISKTNADAKVDEEKIIERLTRFAQNLLISNEFIFRD